MKILMFGRGVISTQYGWAFEKAGHSVDFYVRPGRRAKYGNTVVLDIFDARDGFKGKSVKESWPIHMREDLPGRHDYDLIIVSVQHYHFKEAADFLSTKAANATILVFNNFWNEPLNEASSLPVKQVIWGFPVAGGGFDDNGVLKGAFFRKVYFGTFGTELTEREIAIRNLFSSIRFKVDEQKDFRSWLLVHFAMNAGILLQTLQTGSALIAFTSYFHWKNVILNVRELVPILKIRGVNLKESSQLNLLRLPPLLISLAMRIILKISPPMKMVIGAHTNIEETKSYCRDILEEAHILKISVPRLEAAKRFFSK